MDSPAPAASPELLRLRQIFDALLDPVVVTDTRGRVLEVNQAAERFYGRPRDRFVGVRAEELQGAGGRPMAEFMAEVGAALVSAGQWTGEVSLPADETGPRTGWIRVVPLLGPEGERAGSVSFVRDITGQQRMSAELGSTQRNLQTLLDLAPIGLAQISTDAVIVRVNPELCRILGYAEQELLGMRYEDLMVAEDAATVQPAADALMRGDREISALERRYRHRDGHLVWCQAASSLVRDEKTGEPESFVLVVEDITQRRMATDRLAAIASTHLALAGIELSPQKVMAEICRHAQTLTAADGALIQMLDGDVAVTRAATGLATGPLELAVGLDGLTGSVIRGGEPVLLADTNHDPRAAISRRLVPDLARSLIMVPLRRGGEILGLVTVTGLEPDHFSDQDRQTLAVLAESFGAAIDNAWQLEDAAQQASTDGLTGLTNRVAALHTLEVLLGRHTGPGRHTAVIFIDLDGFKPVNDVLGHDAGDEVLVQVAVRLRAAIRTGDTAARYGGDEFLVIGHDLATPQDAEKLGARILAALPGSYAVDGGTGSAGIGASLGVAVTGRGGVRATELLRVADEAMYAAKQAGGNRCETREF